MGISAVYHDRAASLVVDGEIIAAAQEERFTRKKHDPGSPHYAIQYCLKEASIKASEIDNVVFYEKPFVTFERLLETYLAFAPKGFKSFAKAMPLWIKEKLFQKNLLFNKLKEHDSNYKSDENIFFSDHHLSHAASAFFPSPFEEAIVLTADGVGEWATTTVAIGKGNKLDIKKAIKTLNNLRQYNFSQGVVVRNKKIVSIEGKGGTKMMIEKSRSKKFRNHGVLVKFPKKKQDLRIDLPTIGLKTLKQSKAAGLKGIVVKNKQHVFLDRSKCINFADKNGMFIAVK